MDSILLYSYCTVRLLDGVQLILDTLRETFDTAIRSGASELDPKSLIIAGVVLLYFGYRKISSMA